MSNLNKAEKFVLGSLNNGLSPMEILEEMRQKFGKRIPPEYDQAWKRSFDLHKERCRNVRNENYQSRNWRNAHYEGKLKRK